MNNETMAVGTLLILAGLWDTYLATADQQMPIGEIFLLSGGALLINHARNGETLQTAIENVAKSMVSVKGA